MAAKKSKEKSHEKAPFKAFVNVDIPSDRKDECKQFIRQDEAVAMLIEEAICSGYKFSIVRNDKNDTYIASMQCMDSVDKNAGLVMSAHAGHWYDAMAVVIWKHYQLLGQVWDKPELIPHDDIG